MLQASRRDQSDSPGTAHYRSLTPSGTQALGTQFHSPFQNFPRRTKCNPLPYTHTLLEKCLLVPMQVPRCSHPIAVLHRHLPCRTQAMSENWLQENLENVVLRFLAFIVKESGQKGSESVWNEPDVVLRFLAFTVIESCQKGSESVWNEPVLCTPQACSEIVILQLCSKES